MGMGMEATVESIYNKHRDDLITFGTGIAGADHAEFRLRDGTALTADVDENGYAAVAWDHDTPLVGVAYEGISPELAGYLDSFTSDDPMSCAEMSAAKPG